MFNRSLGVGLSWLGLLSLAMGCASATPKRTALHLGDYDLTLVVESRTPLMPGLDTLIGAEVDSGEGVLRVESIAGDSARGTVVFPWKAMGLPIATDTVGFSASLTVEGANIVLADNVNEAQLWLAGVGIDSLTGSWQSQRRNTKGQFILRRQH